MNTDTRIEYTRVILESVSGILFRRYDGLEPIANIIARQWKVQPKAIELGIKDKRNILAEAEYYELSSLIMERIFDLIAHMSDSEIVDLSLLYRECLSRICEYLGEGEYDREETMDFFHELVEAYTSELH